MSRWADKIESQVTDLINKVECMSVTYNKRERSIREQLIELQMKMGVLTEYLKVHFEDGLRVVENKET